MCFIGHIRIRKEKKPLTEVPLVGVHVHSEIADLSAKIRVSQRFVNNSTDILELSYEFPLPLGAAVCSFVAEIDGKKVKSILQEKSKARDTYDDAIASGHGAYLAEKEESGAFKSSIGSLPPSKEVLLILEYVVPLKYDGNQVHLSVKGNDRVTSLSQGSTNVPFADKKVTDGLTVTSKITTSFPIVSVTSDSHDLDVKRSEGDREAFVTFKNLERSNENNISLSFECSEPFSPTSNSEKDSQGNLTAAVSFHPDLKAEESNDEVFTELIFLVDCSGSMSGSPIKAVNQTLQIFLRSLPETCLFNIIDFGSTSRSLFPNYSSVKYSEESLQTAVVSVEKKTASLGGTDLLPPLKQIFSKPTVRGYSRQVFLLTDGQVSNSKDCIDECAKNAHDTRVFTFGIGNDVDVNLVRNIAKESNGVCELLPYGSNFEEPVMRQLIRALKPSISNLSFNVEGLSVKEVKSTPFHPPPIYAGDHVVFYINVDKEVAAKHEKLTAKVSGFIGSKAFIQSVDIDTKKAKKIERREDSLVAYLYGSSAIQDFEKNRSFLHDASGKLSNGISDAEVKKQTLETSLKTGILCKLTAFVAVEERDVAVEGVPKQLDLKTQEGVELIRPTVTVDYMDMLPVSPRPFIPIHRPAPTAQYSALPSFGAMNALPSSHPYDSYGALPARRTSSAAPGSSFSLIESDEDELSSSPSLLRKKSSEKKKSEKEGSYGALSNFETLSAPPPPPLSYGGYQQQPQQQSFPPAPSRNAPVSAFGGGKGGVSAFGGGGRGGHSYAPVVSQSSSMPSYGALPNVVSAFGSSGPASVASAKPIAKPVDPNLPIASQLVQSQNANGSFKDTVLAIMRVTWDDVKRNLPSGSGTEVEAVLLAALVCAYLEAKCQKEQTSWTLVVKKARSWIRKESERLTLDAAAFELAASTLVATM